MPTIDTTKSHVNKVAGDEDSWQQIATRALEACKQVVSYVRNQYLEFYIPYLEGTTERNYMPDFIAVVQKPDGENVNLLIEISHFPTFDPKKQETIRRYVNDYWVEAVNTLGKYGRCSLICFS
jgi:type III restriction enzyme